MATTSHSTVQRRTLTYVFLALGLLAQYLIFGRNAWVGETQYHTLTEESASLLALIIGAIALIRYYSHKNLTFLFIGTGFIGTALFDGYHALITSTFYAQTFRNPSIVPWSGLASRLLLSICLWLSWLSWKREYRRGQPSKIAELKVYSVIGALTLGIFILLARVNLPKALHPDWILARPQELVPGLFFLLALFGYLKKGLWKESAFEHSLVLSLICGVIGQTVYMSTAQKLYGSEYFLAHFSRLLSYTLVLIGLLISMYRLFRRAEASAEEIRAANLALRNEMAGHERAVVALRLEEQRMKTLLQLNEMTEASLQELTDFALEEAVRLTRSQIGYLAFMDEAEKVLTMHSWSRQAMRECEIPEKPLIYPIEQTGLWGEAVRQRKPVITNDYSAPSPLKKTYPKGHVPIHRHMNVPVFEGKRIVAVAGLGNKDEPYDESDVTQLRLLMTGMWQLLQRRRTEAALEASRQLFGTFMDNSPAVAFLKDNEGHLLYVNATFERVFHVKFEQVKGKTDIELWPPLVARKLREADSAVLSGNRPLEFLEVVPTPEGGLRQWLSFKFAFRDAQNQLRLGGMAVDITERQRAQEELKSLNETLENRVAERTALAEQRARELERSNIELEQFAYVASHDLQEPLRSISSFTQLLARRYSGKLDAQADEFIQYVVSGAMRMSNMIRDLLAYSRAGRPDKPLKPTDCNAVLNEALGNLKLFIEETGAQVTHSPLPKVMADSSQLTRLFQNLISNALKFHGESAPRVYLEAQRQDGAWCFAVQDNGIGIAPEQFGRLFLIFQRLHDPAKYSGSGIGLAVCKKIVERHGGRIWAESKPGAGATFYFTIPDIPDPQPKP